MHFVGGALLDRIELLMLLQLVECLSLLLNHVTMSEGEVIDSLDRLHPQLVALSLTLLVLQDLISLDKGIDLVCLVFVLEEPLFMHLLALEFKQTLLIFSILDLVEELSVALLVDLIDDLA